MNPETTLSEQDIRHICEANSLDYASSVRVTTGFTNEIHLINDSVILKVCIRADNVGKLHIEASMLKSAVAFAKPHLLAEDFTCQIISQPYLLMEYVPGKPLGSVWHTFDDTTRGRLVNQIVRNLQLINTISSDELFETQTPWGDKLLADFEKGYNRLLDDGTLQQSDINLAREILKSHLTLLNDGKMATTFWDVHFDNFIVDDAGRLQAVIDLESTSYAPLDYPLVVIENMADSPARFLSPENEPFASKQDYRHLRDMYQRHYPAMFNYKHLSERLAIYHMLDAIHLLKDWPNSDWAHTEFSTHSQQLAAANKLAV
jgi:aminoglycoside phosphotransferase (APT) family kinase protein